MKVIVIGGGVAGCQAAVTLKKFGFEVMLIDKKEEIGYSPCSLPYVLSGEMNIDEIWPFSKEMLETQGINLHLNEEVVIINRKEKIVITRKNGKENAYNYDYLILAMGSIPKRVRIDGLNEEDISFIKTPEDIRKLKKLNKEKFCVIGGGFIGLETALALRKRDKKVIVIEAQKHVLPGILDQDMAMIVEKYLEKEGVKIFHTTIKEVSNDRLILNNGEVISSCDHYIFSLGVKPNTVLAMNSGISVSDNGIRVNKYMQTNDKYIYAVGDCIETNHLLLRKKINSHLAVNAVHQALIAVRHIAKREKMIKDIKPYEGMISVSISRIGNLFVASAGLSEEIASMHNIPTISQKISTTIMPREYRNGVENIVVKLVVNKNKELIGGQVIGKAGVLTRINMLALLIKQRVTVNDLEFIETAYNPTCTTTIDPIAKAAMVLKRKIE